MKKDEVKKWETTSLRFVAIFDILGFKDLIARINHEKIYEMMLDISKMKSQIKDLFNSDNSDIPEKYREKDIHISNFSDSFIIFSKDDSIISFKNFIFTLNWLFASCIEKNIPLKGAVAFGKISVDTENQIYFGQPIIDAHFLHEEIDYLGVVFHNTVDNYLNGNKMKNSPLYFEAKTFLKSGKINHTNLNWFDILNRNKSTRNSLDYILSKFKLNVSGKPRKYIDNTISMLKENRKKIIRKKVKTDNK